MGKIVFACGSKTMRSPAENAHCGNESILHYFDVFSDVMAKSSDFVCPRFHVEDDSITPATCLVCGEMLCSQVSLIVMLGVVVLKQPLHLCGLYLEAFNVTIECTM